MAEVVDPERVVMRDAKSYCAILLDDNNRKPICRLHLDRQKRAVTLFDEGKAGEKVPIENLRDLYQFAGRLRATAQVHD